MASRMFYLHLCVCNMTLVSFILLALATFSAPLSDNLYFLRSSHSGGVRFGTWGWCLEQHGVCSFPMKLGYLWEPQIDTAITVSLVLYPIATIFALFFLIALAPVIAMPNPRIACFTAVASFMVSASALILTIGTFETARKRFLDAGFSAEFGPLVWTSLVATILLAGASMLSFRIIVSEKTSDPLLEKESCLTAPPFRRRLRPIRCIPRP